MSGGYRNNLPGEQANSSQPQNPGWSWRQSRLASSIPEEYLISPNRTRGVTSQPGKSSSVLDWLGRGDADAAGKNLIPIRRPQGGTQNDRGVGPFGPINAYSSTNDPNPTLASDRRQDDDPADTQSGLKPPRQDTQGLGMTDTENPTTSLAASPPSPNPFLARRLPWETISVPAVGMIEGQSGSRTTTFDAVHDPSDPSKKDVIFKMSIPIEEDFQPYLEEFCRLRRLGRFNDAEEHFQHTLKHLCGVPYVLVHYCEMLLASGAYRSFRTVSYRNKYPSLESDETVKHPCLDMLEGNFWLLDVLAKVSQPFFDGDIFQAIKRMLRKLELEPALGSTEIQILVLCLTILGYLEDSLGQLVTNKIKDHYYKQVFDWNRLYHRLLGENRIWDLRDLLVVGISLYGTQFLSQCLGVASFSKALDRLLEEWIQPEYDESTTLGLLDLFTSLLIERPSSIEDDPKHTLLLEHSKSLAESIQVRDPRNMKSRPFVQWIIAKAISETGDIPQRPDGLRLQDFPGITISPGRGVHLPVYIPAQPGDKPHWGMFSVRSSPRQRQALHVALQAATFLGDRRLQLICLKLLILHTQEPRALMDSLASLQLEHGDIEGFLETCLAKYLSLSSEDEAGRVSLIHDFGKVDSTQPGQAESIQLGVYNTNSLCQPMAALLWAKDVITRLLADNPEDEGKGSFILNNIGFWNTQLTKYGSRLPAHLANQIQEKFGVEMPERIQVPHPPLPDQGPPFHELSAVAMKSATSFPANPQIPQDNPFDVPIPMAYNVNHAEPFGAPYPGPSYPLNPFSPPDLTHPTRWQGGRFGQSGLFPPQASPRTGFYHPGSGLGDVASRLQTGHYSPPFPSYPSIFPSEGSHNYHQSRPPMNHRAQEKDIFCDSEDDDILRPATKYPVRGDLVTAALPRKKTKHRIPANRMSGSEPYGAMHWGRRGLMTEPVDEYSDSYDGVEWSDLETDSLADSSSVIPREAIYYGRRPKVKKPEAPALSESEDFSGQSSEGDNHDEDQHEEDGSDSIAQVTRIMSPTINVSRVGNRQNLSIVSDLSEQNDISIVMTDKANVTKSKVYTIKDGQVTRRIVEDRSVPDRPASAKPVSHASVINDDISRPSARPSSTRASMSQSSMKTVRPFRPSISIQDPRTPPAPNTTIHEEQEGATKIDKSKMMSHRVQKANKYMDRKTHKWLKDQNQDRNAASSSKILPSFDIRSPQVRSASPSSLANAVSTDGDAGKDGDDDGRRKGDTAHGEGARMESDSKSTSVASSAGYSAIESDVSVGISSNSAAPASSDSDAKQQRQHRLEKRERDIRQKERVKDDKRREFKQRKQREREEREREERLADRLNGTRTRRSGEPSTVDGKKLVTPTVSPTRRTGSTLVDKGKAVDVKERVVYGKRPVALDTPPQSNVGLAPKAVDIKGQQVSEREVEEQSDIKKSKKAVVEEVTVEEVD